MEVRHLPIITGRWCFVDGSWKDREIYSGQDWYNTFEGFKGLMEAKKHLGKSLTFSLGDGSADMGNGVYAEFASVFGHVCYHYKKTSVF